MHSSHIAALVVLTLPISCVGILNWDINYQSLDVHLSKVSTDDITITYQIGTNQDYTIALYTNDCETAITGMPNLITVPTIISNVVDADHDQLDLDIGIEVTEITSSAIWDEDNDILTFCSVVQLLYGGEVITEE